MSVKSAPGGQHPLGSRVLFEMEHRNHVASHDDRRVSRHVIRGALRRGVWPASFLGRDRCRFLSLRRLDERIRLENAVSWLERESVSAVVGAYSDETTGLQLERAERGTKRALPAWSNFFPPFMFFPQCWFHCASCTQLANVGCFLQSIPFFLSLAQPSNLLPHSLPSPSRAPYALTHSLPPLATALEQSSKEPDIDQRRRSRALRCCFSAEIKRWRTCAATAEI